MVIKTELQSKIKDLRIDLGFKNQTAFAKALGITQGAVANIESGTRDVSKPILLKIREVFNIDLISWEKGKLQSVERQEMISDSDKLKQLRKDKKLTQAKLADELKVSKSLIIAIENGDRNISLKLLKKIQEKYNMNLYSVPPAPAINDNSNIIALTLYDIGAAAGAGTWLTDEPEQNVIYFDKRFLKQILKSDNFASLHIIYAKGDSMDSGWNQPDDIKDGDLLMVDTSQTTGNNQIFVILVNNSELRVKKLFKRGEALYIYSNNSKYKEEVYYPDNTDFEVKVIGKVVWNGSKENV